jgi:hypothetical protein
MKLPKWTRPPLEIVKSFIYPQFWGVANPQELADAVMRLKDGMQPGVHFADNFLTWGRNNSMFDDEAFVAAWEANIESPIDRAIVWRRYVLACAAYHCVQLDGDFVECGAYKGIAVKTVMDYLGGADFPKTFWAYDLFEHEDGMAHHSMPEHGPALYDRVKAKFSGYKQVKVVKGPIPDVFAEHLPDKIAYLHIDMNEAPAEIAALEHLFDRLVPAGMLILDDYEWAMAYRGQKLAEDPWFDARGYRVMPLPTGQGLVIKR